MAISLTFHCVQKLTLVKNEATGSTWYNVTLHSNDYMGRTVPHEFSIFCDNDVTTLSPFEEMWQAQEAERLAEEKRINDEEDAARAAMAKMNGESLVAEFGTDPDLAAELTEGTSPLESGLLDDPAPDNLLDHEESINASR